MVTIKDIAVQTGLSPASVARALGDHGSVRPETRARVREAAAQLGYVASSAARSMRRQSSNMVGLIVPDIVNRFYSEMAQTIAAACDARGLHFLLAITDDDCERELRQMRTMVAARAAAVALVPGPYSHPEMEALICRQPFTQLVRKSNRYSSDWFGFEEAGGIDAATTHLLELGHRRILLVCSGDMFSTGVARKQGYLDAYKRYSLDIDPNLIRAGDPTFAHGVNAVEELPPEVTAIIAAGTLLTEGVVDAVTRQKRRVPEEISIVGFGIERWHRWWFGGMSRIIPPVDILAQSSAQYLLERIDEAGKDDMSGVKNVRHQTAFEIGQTTAPPASA